jgi:hypothetical protein
MTDEEFMRHAEEAKRLIENPEPPDDPDENNEFQEWIYFENGRQVTVRRRNPRARKITPASKPNLGKITPASKSDETDYA